MKALSGSHSTLEKPFGSLIEMFKSLNYKKNEYKTEEIHKNSLVRAIKIKSFTLKP